MNIQAFDLETLKQSVEQMSMQQLMQQSAQLKGMLKKEPRNHHLLVSIALLLCKTKEYLDAVKHLKRALKLQPRYEPAIQALCDILIQNLRKYPEALKYLKKWQLFHKGEGSALIWVSIAECHIAMDNPRLAFSAINRAKQIDPNLQMIYVAGTKIYSKVGDLELAMESAKKAFEIDPNALASDAIASLPNFGTDIAVVEQLAEVAERAEDPQISSNLHAYTATGYEKLGEYEKAFRHFELSNKHNLEKLDREAASIPFKNVRETFTGSFLDSRKGQGHENRQPIFIVGMPRSGTTLTESILAGHPNIIDNGELFFMYFAMNNLGFERWVEPSMRKQLQSFQYLMNTAPDDYFEDMGQGYLDESGFDRKSRKMQVDKLPHNFFAVGLISIVFPNAKIIHCRRHPIDCALSCYKQLFNDFHSYATDLEHLGLYYRQYWELMKHWREVLPGKMFEVCYEDTVANTELVARNMIDHLGLEWDDRCLDHTGSKKTVSTASQWQVRQAIYTTSVAKWKHYEKQLQPMIKNMGSCVEEYEAELAAIAN